jgi:hypothetical protein
VQCSPSHFCEKSLDTFSPPGYGEAVVAEHGFYFGINKLMLGYNLEMLKGDGERQYVSASGAGLSPRSGTIGAKRGGLFYSE